MNSAVGIEIPHFLSHLPVHHGLAVPFMQAWINGKPDFRAVDPAKTIQCVQEKLCGRRLGEKSYFIGGPLSKVNRLFTDAPMHKQCAEFAATTCPFVSGKKLDYSDRPVNPAMAKVHEMVSTERPARMYILTGWTKKTQLVRHNNSILIHAGSWIGTRQITAEAVPETYKESQRMKPKTFKNSQEFARYMKRVTCKPFKAAASTEGTTAHKYLSGQRDWSSLFTDSDLVAILDDKHPDGGLLYVFSDHSSVVHKPKRVQ